MRTMDDPERRATTNKRGMPAIELDAGLAYEFIQSLIIYHEHQWHEKRDYEYELGESWFENIQATCSQDVLAGLADLTVQSYSARCWLHSWSHLLGMVYDAPAPKDIPALFSYLESLEPLEIRLYWLGYYQRQMRKITPLDIILRAVEGDEEALEQFFKIALSDSPLAQERIRKLVALDGEEMKGTIIKLLEGWYEQVFREQEEQIRPILERD